MAAGQPISVEGLEKLTGVSHLIALDAQKVAASRSVDLDRSLGEVDECQHRLKKARLEPKEEPDEVPSPLGSVWNLVSPPGAGTGSASADITMTEGAAKDSS